MSEDNVIGFVPKKDGEKSQLQDAIRSLVREVNRNKFSYAQLKYIFREVRSRCELKDAKLGRKLFELPRDEEIKAFYSVITNPIHKLIFEVLEGTGLRISELAALKIDRIDFAQNLIFVYEGKGRKDRVTVIGNLLKEKLALYLQGKNNIYLFESNRHTKYSKRFLQELMQKYKSEAKIERRFTCHTFRHIFFSKLAMNGLTKENRMILAGHSSEKVQDIYTHLSVNGIKGEVIKILDKK